VFSRLKNGGDALVLGDTTAAGGISASRRRITSPNDDA
jgi:hypothetical protein